MIKGARSASAPGPSSVPYLVLKRCPELLCQLWKIIGVIWCRWRVANQWRCAEGVWIPKEENSRHIKQLCTISLLSVEGKIFFSVLSRRLTEFVLQNGYIDTSVQKGGGSRSTWLLGAYWCCYTTHLRSTGGKRRSGCPVVGPYQRLWVHATQTGRDCTEQDTMFPVTSKTLSWIITTISESLLGLPLQTGIGWRRVS